MIRAILYVLKQNGLDYNLIAKYIAGNQEKFKQSCLQIFGEDFNNYFNSLNSRDNNRTEQIIIELIANYIKQNGLNISNYWKNNSNQLTQDNLYFKGSPTLSRAVVNCGIESFKPEEQEFYKYFESSVKVSNDNDSFISQDRDDEESKIFITEIKRIIPDIESFKTKFISLRVSCQDKNIFDNLDLANITYSDVMINMNKLLQTKNTDNDELGGIKR